MSHRITDAEIKTLNDANTEDEWNSACDVIKKARNGQYPPDWFLVVLMGGIMNRAYDRFEKSKREAN